MAPSASDGITERVRQALAREVGPALHVDGADLEVLDVTDGVVRVRLHGACSGCPSSTMTLLMLVEQELRRLVPEVEYLEAAP